MREAVGKVVLIVIFMTTFWFSSKPVDESRDQSRRVLIELKILTHEDIENRTPKYLFWGNGIRKMAHFGLYAIAGIVAYLATGSIKKSIVTVFLMGSIDEMHQYFVPGRGAQAGDVFIDTLGGAAGALLMRFFIIRSPKLKGKSKRKSLSSLSRISRD